MPNPIAKLKSCFRERRAVREHSKKTALRPHLLPDYERAASSQEIQTLLKMHWRSLRGSPREDLPSFRDVGFRKFSEFEEDGILLYIFSLIGETDRRVVEICAGAGIECMASNLIIHHGWEGLLFDGSEHEIARCIEFFNAQYDCKLVKPTIVHAWITAENVNDLIKEHGFSGPVDLLSLDLDGNDYWIWKAIEAIEPRVAILETHDIVPDELSLTIPYDPDFFAWSEEGRRGRLPRSVAESHDQALGAEGLSPDRRAPPRLQRDLYEKRRRDGVLPGDLDSQRSGQSLEPARAAGALAAGQGHELAGGLIRAA